MTDRTFAPPAPPRGWFDPALPDALEAHAARLPFPQSTLALHVLGMSERLRASGTVAGFADDVEAYTAAVLDQGLALHPAHRILVEGSGKMLADLARGRPQCGRWLALSLGSAAREAAHKAEVAAVSASVRGSR